MAARYGGVEDVQLGRRLISVFGAASATFGHVILQTQQSQTNMLYMCYIQGMIIETGI